MIVSDVDGTLIYKGGTLNTARFPLMLEKLRVLSVPFALSTGRSVSELQPLFGSFFSKLAAVCCDGACVLENGVPTDTLPIPDETVALLTERALDSGCAVELHGISQVYLIGAAFPLYSRELRRLSSLKKITHFAQASEPICKVTVYDCHLSEERISGARISYQARGVREYVNEKASKLSAVSKLAQLHDLSLSDVLYFGDGKNDADLLRQCGRSFTTYCADKSVFSLAHEHTRDVIGTLIRLADSREI